MEMVAEQQAISFCRLGRKEAFRPLVEAYFARSVRLARAIVGDGEEAKDLAQEAFVAAYRALPKMLPGRPFYPWLRGILLNRCRMYLRTRQRARARRVAAAERPDHWATGARALSTPERRRTADLVRRGLERLSGEDRELLALKHMEGYSYDELAAALGIGRGTVASRLYRARRRMREVLTELDPSLVEGEQSDSMPDLEDEE
ncbi:MAG: RNA polymerase sigma factor [Acidobacteriota bacterium]